MLYKTRTLFVWLTICLALPAFADDGRKLDSEPGLFQNKENVDTDLLIISTEMGIGILAILSKKAHEYDLLLTIQDIPGKVREFFVRRAREAGARNLQHRQTELTHRKAAQLKRDSPFGGAPLPTPEPSSSCLPCPADSTLAILSSGGASSSLSRKTSRASDISAEPSQGGNGTNYTTVSIVDAEVDERKR